MSQVITFTDYVPAARFDNVPWSQVRVEEAATSAGSWATIDTVTLSPLDTDPANPQARNITITNASDTPNLWYRLTFIDGNGNTGEPSTPVQNVSMSTAFATHDDLAARLGVTLTTQMEARANTLLELASDAIRDEVKQQIGLVTDDVLTLSGTTDERILLPERPVVSVASVVLNGHALGEGTDWYLEGNEIVRVPASLTLGVGGLLDTEYVFPLGTGFGWEEQSLVITYTHGYDTVPGKVKSICLEMVVRVWVNPGSVARETVGDTATVYDNMRFSPSGLLPTDEEKKQLRRLFGRSGTSVTVQAGP